jgi:ferritin-like metal-binding protein YciE
MRESREKDITKPLPKRNKIFIADQKKGKPLQNRLSRGESQIKQLEKIFKTTIKCLPVIVIHRRPLFLRHTMIKKPN